MSVSTQAETPPDILRRIVARCDRYKTVDFKWKVVSGFTEHYGKRVQSDPFGNGEHSEPSGKLPTTFVWVGRLQCDRSKLRLSYNPPVWSFPDSRFAKTQRVAVGDGTETSLLSVYDFHTQGIITKGQGLACLGYDHHFVPLITQFCVSQYPVQSLWPDPNYSANVTVGEGKWDDRECVVIRWSNRARVSTDYALWLDPQADYSARRCTSTRGDQLRYDIRIELTQHEGLWMPKRWQWLDYDTPDGDLMAKHIAEVVDVSLNQPIKPSVFELKFPRATSVSDQRVNPPRRLLIGNGQREFEVTSRQTAKAESLEALLEKLEGRKESGDG
jgi:hypothetical protein